MLVFPGFRGLDRGFCPRTSAGISAWTSAGYPAPKLTLWAAFSFLRRRRARGGWIMWRPLRSLSPQHPSETCMHQIFSLRCCRSSSVNFFYFSEGNLGNLSNNPPTTAVAQASCKRGIRGSSTQRQQRWQPYRLDNNHQRPCMDGTQRLDYPTTSDTTPTRNTLLRKLWD